MTTPADVKLKFAEAFLRTGIVTEAAKVAGIPRTTGADIAKALEEDEEFVKTRRALLTHILERAEVQASQLLELAATRAKRKPRELPMGEGGITIHDKSPDYIRAWTDLYRASQQHAKQKLDADPNKPNGAIEIVFKRAEVKAPEPDATD